MAQLVSDFIITPVLRQARRFSAGFAAFEDAAPEASALPLPLPHRRTRSTSDAIAEQEHDDEHAGLPTEHAVLDCSDVVLTPTTGPVRDASARAADIDNAPDLPLPSPGTLLSILENPSEAQLRPETAAETAADAAAAAAATWTLLDAIRSVPLPEDDGMGVLRRRIQAIQVMDVPQHSKAQLMHLLLTEKYTRSQLQSSPVTQVSLRPASPASSSTLDPPEPPEPLGPLQAFRKWNPLGDGSGPVNLPLTDEDLTPTYAPRRRPTDEEEWFFRDETEEEQQERRLGCEHYRRNVKMQCASCERWYTCRLCHDAVEDHVLPRQQTKHMLCMLCGCAQKASDTCTKCGQSAAYYYCGICKLWNDDPNKPIYHCPDCGLCRVGQGLGKDFFHCKVGLSSFPLLVAHIADLPRNAWPALPSPARTSTSASSGRPTATARSATSTCSTRRGPSSSCCAATASTGCASRST